jgi:hypothetical protein
MTKQQQQQDQPSPTKLWLVRATEALRNHPGNEALVAQILADAPTLSRDEALVEAWLFGGL